MHYGNSFCHNVRRGPVGSVPNATAARNRRFGAARREQLARTLENGNGGDGVCTVRTRCVDAFISTRTYICVVLRDI